MFQHDDHKYLDFRPLDLSDVPELLVIEREVYEFPWSEQIFTDCVNSDYHCEAILMYQNIVGYMIISKVLDEAHLLNICLAKEWQGRALGYSALSYLSDRLTAERFTRLFLEVRPSNLSALALYNKLGFDTVGIRKDYYPALGGREDALTMVKPL